jgi:hypothetical protein
VGTDLPIESPNRKAFRYLGIALATSVVIAFPMEQVAHSFFSPGYYWQLHSCNAARIGLDLGNILQAILTPLFVFLLPGPGSVLQRKVVRSSLRGPSRAYGALFIAVGWLCGGAIPVAWWHELRAYAGVHGLCADLFDLGRPVDPSHVDFVSDCSRYYVSVSVFAALWIGIAAGGLRLQSARGAQGDSSDPELRQFQSFFWVYLLGWAVQYRLSQWFSFVWLRTNQEWPLFARLNFVFLTASSLWALAFVRFLWKRRPSSRRGAAILAFGVTFVIYMLTALTFFWLLTYAGQVFAPVVTLNIFGLGWAFAVGIWLAAPAQPLAAAEGKVASREGGSAVFSLRTLEIVAAVAGALLSVAAAVIMLLWLFLVYKGPYR